MKKHSTGALTQEQRSQQDARYTANSGLHYDYLVIGTGNASLTCACLLANAGYRVCLLEVHDQPGGYLHSYRMADYRFCAQVHYIWGCGPGGTINTFLKKLGLEQDIQFDLFDPQGYDQMIMPDGKRVKFPYGWEGLQQNIEMAYPETTGLTKFFDIIKAIRCEAERLPKKVSWWKVILNSYRLPNIIRYRHASLQDVFNLCGIPVEAQTVLSAQAGDFLLPPKRLSFLYYVALIGGYGTGAYHARPDFDHYVSRLVDHLEAHGSHLYFEEPVSDIQCENRKVISVGTASGKRFSADRYICGMDPQAAASVIGWSNFPARYRKRLAYTYSDAGVVVYLGLKPGFDPASYGLGNHNTWHCFDWDMNRMWEAGERLEVDKNWLFVSTPTMHGEYTPQTRHVIELATYVPHQPFHDAQAQSYRDYQRLKMGIGNQMIDLLAEHHVPDLKAHIAVKVIGSPTTNEDFCATPFGNAYGAALLAGQTTSRLSAETPIHNLYWCNATSGSPSICGTVGTGVHLYMDLTGDEFLYEDPVISDDEMIAALQPST